MELGGRLGCHQMPERSFAVGPYQFPLCARCTGLALGELAAFLPAVSRRLPAAPWLGAALLVPAAVDGAAQYAGLHISTNRRRLVTGVLAGVGTIALLKSALCRPGKGGSQIKLLRGERQKNPPRPRPGGALGQEGSHPKQRYDATTGRFRPEEK